MKIKSYKTIKVKTAEMSESGTDINLTARIGFNDINYTIPLKELSTEDVNCWWRFVDKTHNLILRFEADTNDFVDFQTIEINKINVFTPKNINDIDLEPLKLIGLEFGDMRFYVQREGFSVIVAPTGSGKTYNAIRNLKTLSYEFDKILYLNLEITDQDIKNRIHKYHGDRNGINNLYLANTLQMSDIIKFVGDDSACVIVDNIDNFIGGGIDAYNVQNKFVNEFDRWAKQTGNNGIFLTQFVKENGRDTILKENKQKGIMEIDRSITHNQLSGVAQIPRLSRSVIMVYFDFDNDKNYVRILKKGSGKFEHEIEYNG